MKWRKVFWDNGPVQTRGNGGEENMEEAENPMDGIARNLDMEMAAPGKKRRSTEVSTPSGESQPAGASTLQASSLLPHKHMHQ